MLLILAQEGQLPGGGGGAPAAGGGGAPPAGGGAGGAGWEQLIFIGLMLVVFYFLLIRPQQKRAKKHKGLMEGLKRGDTVITSSGIFGRITQIEGTTVTLEIAKNTKVKLVKSYITAIASPEAEKELASNAPQQ